MVLNFLNVNGTIEWTYIININDAKKAQKNMYILLSNVSNKQSNKIILVVISK